MNTLLSDRRKLTVGYWISRIFLILFVLLTFFPLVMLLYMSIKPNILILTDFFGWPDQLEISNYTKSFRNVLRPIINSFTVIIITLFFEIIIISLGGYAFARYSFRGKEVLYYIILGVLMIPGALMTIPLFVVVNQMKLIGTYWAMILPYIAGQQIFGILLARSFYSTLPNDIFESARIDGAGEFYTFLKIALPLSVPILITISITNLLGMYNDYVWPTLVLTGQESQKTFSQAVFAIATGKGSLDYGITSAMFVIGSIPLIVITSSCLKYYLQGMLEGAIKS